MSTYYVHADWLNEEFTTWSLYDDDGTLVDTFASEDEARAALKYYDEDLTDEV